MEADPQYDEPQAVSEESEVITWEQLIKSLSTGERAAIDTSLGIFQQTITHLRNLEKQPTDDQIQMLWQVSFARRFAGDFDYNARFVLQKIVNELSARMEKHVSLMPLRDAYYFSIYIEGLLRTAFNADPKFLDIEPISLENYWRAQ